jgi:hypothetical protein
MRMIRATIRPELNGRRAQGEATYLHFESLEEAIQLLGPERTLDLVNQAHRKEEIRKGSALLKSLMQDGHV